MSEKKVGTALRDRLATEAGKKISGGSASYSLSSAAVSQIRRRLWGSWLVTEHTLGGEPYAEKFVGRILGDLAVEDPRYSAEYRFKEHLCLKVVEISGMAAGDEGPQAYRYRLCMASTWDLDGPGLLRIRPELGYQCTELDGSLVAFKELEAQDAVVLTGFRFESEVRVLEEGEDMKRLERMP